MSVIIDRILTFLWAWHRRIWPWRPPTMEFYFSFPQPYELQSDSITASVMGMTEYVTLATRAEKH